jgi:hypothetical protein
MSVSLSLINKNRPDIEPSRTEPSEPSPTVRLFFLSPQQADIPRDDVETRHLYHLGVFSGPGTEGRQAGSLWIRYAELFLTDLAVRLGCCCCCVSAMFWERKERKERKG